MIWVGDDWAEDHHDVELLGEDGRRLARARLPEGLEGITRLHALIAEHMPASWAELEPAEAAGRVRIGIETDRGMWVQALLAAGYQVSMRSTRCQLPGIGNGTRPPARSPMPATRTCWPRSSAWTTPITGRSPATARPRKRSSCVARAHQSLIWDRTRQVLRLRSALREFFPAALQAFDDLAAGEALELLDRAPDPDRAARLPRLTIIAALRRAGRRDLEDQGRRDPADAAGRSSCASPSRCRHAYAAIVSSQVQLINILNIEIARAGAGGGRPFWPAPGR